MGGGMDTGAMGGGMDTGAMGGGGGATGGGATDGGAAATATATAMATATAAPTIENLPDTGGFSPLLLVATLLLGSGLWLSNYVLKSAP
jgi:hypothetical protein